MKRKKIKNLRLNKETIANLPDLQLSRVNAGYLNTVDHGDCPSHPNDTKCESKCWMYCVFVSTHD